MGVSTVSKLLVRLWGARPQRSLCSVTPRIEELERRDLPSGGYLRIATYNIASSTGTPRSGLDTILQAIGNESLNGAMEQLDVLTLEEVQSQATTTQAVTDLLNNLYGAGTYAHGSLDGQNTGTGTQGIVYNTQTIQLLSEAAVGVASTSGQPRQALRYQLHPIGFSSAADFYLYVSHYKASQGTTNESRRLVEADAIRADADALGTGVQIIYSGDFNTYTSTEPGYQELLSAGNEQAIDPLNRPGAWHNNSNFVGIDSQAPAVSPPPPLTGGGITDRFDFELTSAALADGAGLDYVTGTYTAFGNNGSVGLGGNINALNNTALSDLPNQRQVLNLLTTVSDHLPVVADYQVQKLATSTTLTSTPNPSGLGQSATLTATVSSSSGLPTGTVTFEEGTSVLGTSTLDASGQATFATSALATGSHSLTAVYGGDANYSGSTSSALSQVVLAPPKVTGVGVNENIAALAGAQRSDVQSIVFHFDHAVTLGAGAITLALHPNFTVNGVNQPGGVGTIPDVAFATTDGGLSWEVTFSGAGVVGGSIADGVYDITLHASAVTDSAGQTLAADRVDTFYRLFGDSNGDQRVNNTDLSRFAATFNLSSGQMGYLAYFDFNGDGRINNLDLAQFAFRFNTVWGGFTPTI
jgi:endonuclease/exonuclease/phosphatase family metal-dependent hydrolase